MCHIKVPFSLGTEHQQLCRASTERLVSRAHMPFSAPYAYDQRVRMGSEQEHSVMCRFFIRIQFELVNDLVWGRPWQ